MKRKRYSDEQIVQVLRESEAGAKTTDICRKYGMSEPSFYKWKSRYSGMDVSMLKKLKSLEEENSKLKHLLADQLLDNKVLKELLSKNF
jgi:putative transposase